MSEHRLDMAAKAVQPKLETCLPLPIYAVRALVGQGSVAHLDLDGQIYTLRITRAGKLILTK
jgi:hemin uptake protein HemP